MLNQAKNEAQIQIQRAIIEERNKKEIAVQQAIAQTRAEMSEKEPGITVVTYEGWASTGQQGQIPNIMVAAEPEAGAGDGVKQWTVFIL